MMTYKKFFLFMAVMALAPMACEDPYNDNVDASQTDYVNNDNQRPPSALDTWLQNNFTAPYNIEVKYRWDASELDLFRAVVPPSVSKVQGVMEVVKKVWIDTYTKLAGEAFIKRYAPKQFVLVGSASYNFDGSVLLGTAEGGRKVVLYVVNDFDSSEEYAVKEMMHTIEHEFAHILHQNISYPSDFKEITPGDYTANWNITSLSQARARGFITSYAMASPDEDFVEMVAMMLVEGKEGYEAILTCETSAQSLALIRKKEKMVVQYFKDAYNIDFYALQEEVQKAIRAIVPDDGGGEVVPPLFDAWGFDKENTTVRFDLTVLNEPADFVARYNYDNSVLQREGLSLDHSFKLFFSGEEEITLRLYYYTNTGDRENFEANLYMLPQRNANGTVTLLPMGADDNGYYLLDGLRATGLASFFVNRPLTINWTTACSGERYVGFYPAAAPEKFCFGILGN
ncbi:putative zinc-binding metallopeptidase [Fulvivirgaceae bacterium PWU4]|uniref:Zinc-binding metallopeptidase n=1 Tax=Chryseosolibacter histidini TaxID=2782349 RepID=A0AAP2DK07_9BACT|nr:putative zinc-binding metallopeptidase [Chryseosolibacter histidini]MBT1695264.1 putative zinc-binding metallopeptidase [Chryseosolibacter histidini]